MGFLTLLAGSYFRRTRPAPHHPKPETWSDEALTLAWLGHSTVLINDFGVRMVTDPVLGTRVGLRLGPVTIGPKRYIRAALRPAEMPALDLVLLTHAHMDHLDLRTLSKLNRSATVITAESTKDLIEPLGFARVIELGWRQEVNVATAHGAVAITAFEVRHWGARMRTDSHRGYNGYLVERNGKRIVVTGDTAYTHLLRWIGESKPADIMLAPIGAYHPWVTSHCNPEEAIAMADDAGARFVAPIHHQTFKLSWEPMDEPIERFCLALKAQPERIAWREVGETFVLP